ncbi:MAG: taurine ABC transporter substrate-binding protein, partial [Clostridia bacterium]|nr:taurine ABC transporter substrate-binding protein [Clostridia bacterium]
MKKSKIIAGILSAVIALSAFAGCGNNTSATGEEGKATTVTIGTLDLVNGDLIAQYEKWYETELGVDVKIVKFDSGK